MVAAQTFEFQAHIPTLAALGEDIRKSGGISLACRDEGGAIRIIGGQPVEQARTVAALEQIATDAVLIGVLVEGNPLVGLPGKRADILFERALLSPANYFRSESGPTILASMMTGKATARSRWCATKTIPRLRFHRIMCPPAPEPHAHARWASG